MDKETLENAIKIDGTIKELENAIANIGDLLQHDVRPDDYQVVLQSHYHGGLTGARLDTKYIFPELREALQKAQVRLRYEVTELKKEFEAL